MSPRATIERILLVLTLIAVSLLGPGRASATVLEWSHDFDFEPFGPDSAALAVAASGGLAFVAGSAYTGGPPIPISAILAYDGSSGSLLWRHAWPSDTYRIKLAADGSRVYMSATVASSPLSWRVRAYDPSSGTTLWEHNTSGIAWDMAIGGGHVYVVGKDGPFGNGPWATIRAYNQVTGALAWTHVVKSPIFNQTWFRAVTTVGATVIATGSATIPNTADWGVTIAYNASSSSPLWGDISGTAGSLRFLEAIAANATHVFVGGTHQSRWVVRALDLNTGAAAWEWLGPNNFKDNFIMAMATASSGRVVAVGTMRGPGAVDGFHVEGLDTATGLSVWAQTANPGTAWDVVMTHDDHAAVVGEYRGGKTRTGAYDYSYVSRGYVASSGVPSYVDVIDTPLIDGAYAVAWDPGLARLYTVGRIKGVWAVRAYSY